MGNRIAKRFVLAVFFHAVPSCLVVAEQPVKPAERSGEEWFVPARMNYGTWAQNPEEDFPDGNVDGKMQSMAQLGMKDYFFFAGDDTFHRQLFPAARKHGVRLWVRTFGQATYSEQDAKDHPERLFQMDWTRARRIACLSWPENQVEWVTWKESPLREDREFLYGVNLDFIRYPDDSPCSCTACRALYKRWLGREDVSEEDLDDRELAQKYAEMRNSVISNMVRKVRAMCDRLGLKLSVCVFADLNHARMLGQDWPQWSRNGLVDVVCPMSYTGDRAQHERWLRAHVAAMNNEAELWDSVARAWGRGENAPEEVLSQSLNVLHAGAHGLASYNMAAFNDKDWQLQTALQNEHGWNISIREQRVDVSGPPFAWIKVSRQPSRPSIASDSQLEIRAENGSLLICSRKVWMQAADAISAVSPGQLAKYEITLHNGTFKGVSVRCIGRLRNGWQIEEPADSFHVPAKESRKVAVTVRVPESTVPGRYWIDIMAEEAGSGSPIARSGEIVDVEMEGARFAVLPLSNTRYTSLPTWVPVDVVRDSRETESPPSP